jgi:transposase
VKRQGGALPASGEAAGTATLALGLPGFVVLTAAGTAVNWNCLIETTESVTGCPECGVVAVLDDRRPRWVRDLPAGGRPVTLVWFTRVWRCAEPAGGRRSWSERAPAIRPRAVRTERAPAECARRVGEDATDGARVAVELGVGRATVMRAVWEYGHRILDQQWLHTNVTVLGLDETASLAATAVRSMQFITGLVDLSPPPAGARPACSTWSRAAPVRSSPTGWTSAARTGAPGSPPRRWIPSAATHGRCGPPCRGATGVLDAFHAVRLAQQAIDDVRRRVPQDTRGHRGRTGDPLHGIRRVRQRGAEHLSPNAYGRLLAGLDVGDPRGEVAAADIAGQELRHLYAAPDTDRARRRLHTFYPACAAPGGPELERLGRTISAWEEQLLAYFRTCGVSNGPAEAVNLLVKRIRHVSVNRVRIPQLRQLPAPPAAALRCHWHTQRPTRIRGRSPRSMA